MPLTLLVRRFPRADEEALYVANDKLMGLIVESEGTFV